MISRVVIAYDMATQAHTSPVDIRLDQFTLDKITHKITHTLSIINTGKKITTGVVKNVSLLWDEERTDFITPHGRAVVGFRKAFLIKVNNRTNMIGMPRFTRWEDAIEVLTGDISNPFLGDIRDISKLTLFPEGIYVGELHDGKQHGVGRMVFREEWSFYTGEWNDGLYHGVGKMLLKRGKKRDIYEGEWENGKKQGNGKMIHVGTIDPANSNGWFDSDSYIYNGDWRKDEKHGVGKLVVYSHDNEHPGPIETVYEGEWKNNLFHGKGKLFYDFGNIYTGEFRNGYMHGVGKVIYYNDREDEWYEGEWEEGVESGEGKKMFKNGDFYEGEYYNFGNDYWYKGKKTYANGDVYVGNFYNDVRWGYGEMSFLQDGSIYHGTWSNDKIHGKGTFTYSDGTIDMGKWRRGVRADDEESIGSYDSAFHLVSDTDGSFDDLSHKSVEKSKLCPSCKTLTASFIKSFPSPNVMCVCCRDEFCPIYCTMPCGHFICEECKDTYYSDNIPYIGVLNINNEFR